LLLEEAEEDLIREASKHAAVRILRSVPGIGPLRAAFILGIAVTPHRFRTIKQFWNYCGLAVRTTVSAEHEIDEGQTRRSKKRHLSRGLNRNYNRALKEVFKSAAGTAARGPWKIQFKTMVDEGKDSSPVMLDFARKISAITLAVWKKGERYDEKKLKFAHAV
jgi:transposase